MYAHLRIHQRIPRSRARAPGERLQPALGAPLVRVRAPEALVVVDAHVVDDHERAGGDEELANLTPVAPGDGRGEGEDLVGVGPDEEK